MGTNRPLDSEFLRLARAYKPRQISIRRRLHRQPELSFEEFKTTALIRETITDLGLRLLPISSPTGVLAEVRGSRRKPVVAVRTDIDALPIQEETELRFKSRTPGCMHACGHDVHMATVLGVAATLVSMKDRLPGTVRFIFQPGEEKPPGGARPLIADGALEDVSAILGLHVDPHLATGRIGLRDGVTMGSVTDFDLVIHGRGGHAARPHTAVDAIVIASEVVASLQKIVSREIDPITPAVITFGRIEGGGARNVIANRVVLNGTARALSARTARRLPKLIKRTAAAVCRAHRGRAEMKIVASYPILSNDARINRLLARNYESLFGKGKISLTEQVLGGEDFACYLEQVPGAMFRLGVMNRAVKATEPWHSPSFIADEAAMYFGTALLSATVFDFLENGL